MTEKPTAPKHVPQDVREALDRMCTPLDESVLKGATANADARCMRIIRDYIYAHPAGMPEQEWLDRAMLLSSVCETDRSAWVRNEIEYADLLKTREELRTHLARRVAVDRDAVQEDKWIKQALALVVAYVNGVRKGHVSHASQETWDRLKEHLQRRVRPVPRNRDAVLDEAIRGLAEIDVEKNVDAIRALRDLKTEQKS